MNTADRCSSCDRITAHYRAQGQSDAGCCLRCYVSSRSVVRRSLLTAAVVGTILTLINQTAVFTGQISLGVGLRVGLTYCVPYLVTTWGMVGSARLRA